MRTGSLWTVRLAALIGCGIGAACSGGGSHQSVPNVPVTLSAADQATAQQLVETDSTLAQITNGSPVTITGVSPWHPNAEFTSADAPAVPGVAVVGVSFAHSQVINADVPSGNCDGSHFVGGQMHLIVTTPVSGLSVIVDTNARRVLAFTRAGSDVMGVSPDIPGTSTPFPEVACHFGPPS